MSLMAKLRDVYASGSERSLAAGQCIDVGSSVATVATVAVANSLERGTNPQHRSAGIQSDVDIYSSGEKPSGASVNSVVQETNRLSEVLAGNPGQARNQGIAMPVHGAALPSPGNWLGQSAKDRFITPIATATLATVATLADASCTACANVTKFGNCSTPVAAGLSDRFMLVSDPQQGRNCSAFNKRLQWQTEEALKAVKAALSCGAIDTDDAEIAQSAIKAADGNHPLLGDWLELLACCRSGSG